MMDLFLTSKQLFTDKMLIDGLELVWIIVMFLSAVWTFIPLTATHSLQRIHWWASDGMMKFLQICYDEETKSASWLAREWVNFQQIFILAELFLKLISCFFHNKIIFNTYTLKNKGASQCHRITFFSKWFHKRNFNIWRIFHKRFFVAKEGSSDYKKVRKRWFLCGTKNVFLWHRCEKPFKHLYF